MLAKVSKKRRDGGTSFRSLTDYIVQEIDEETGEIVGRGEVWSVEILDPVTAAKEMKLVALMNPRCADPVYHYILTWREGEQPASAQWEESVRETLAALGFAGHQAVAVAHTNTGNFHVHVAVNRVHPETYKAHYPEWSHRSLDECLRRLERRFGWQEDHGLFVWNEELEQPVRTPKWLLDRWRREREEQGRGAIGKAGAREAFTDLESLEGYCRGEPARALRKAFDAEGCSWQSLHQTLARYGLALHPGERGGYTVSRMHQSEPRVKASTALREVFAGKKLRALLDRRLGPFEASAGPLPHAEKIYKPNRPHRGEQRERRAILRNALIGQYRDYKRSLPSPALPSAQEINQRRQAITDYFRAEREKVKASAMAPAERRAALSVLAMRAVQAREALRVELREQRATAKAVAAPTPWAEWVADQAARGDQAAISALRGIAYADRRRRRAMELADQESGNAIMAADGVPRDPEEPPRNLLAHIQWQVNRQTGSVTYTFRAGRFPVSFTDEGRRILLSNAATRSHDAIEAGLKLARQKFGPLLTIAGDPAFQARVVEVLVAMRPPMDVRFSDPELEAHRLSLVRRRDNGHSAAPPIQRSGTQSDQGRQAIEQIHAPPAPTRDGSLAKKGPLHDSTPLSNSPTQLRKENEHDLAGRR